MFYIDWIVKGIAFVILFVLDLFGSKRAGKRLEEMTGLDKDDRPVV